MDMDAHFGRPGPHGPGDEMNIIWTIAQPMIRILKMMLAGPVGGDPNDIMGNDIAEKKDGPSTVSDILNSALYFFSSVLW